MQQKHLEINLVVELKFLDLVNFHYKKYHCKVMNVISKLYATAH